MLLDGFVVFCFMALDIKHSLKIFLSFNRFLYQVKMFIQVREIEYK